MSHRWKRWTILIGTTIFLTVGGPRFEGLPSWANQSPGESSEGDGTLEVIRPPGPADSGHGSGGGETSGIRQGADPNDFTVTSPRRPEVTTSPIPELKNGNSLRNWLQALVARLTAFVRH